MNENGEKKLQNLNQQPAIFNDTFCYNQNVS